MANYRCKFSIGNQRYVQVNEWKGELRADNRMAGRKTKTKEKERHKLNVNEIEKCVAISACHSLSAPLDLERLAIERGTVY
jgi:hypothetical protein